MRDCGIEYPAGPGPFVVGRAIRVIIKSQRGNLFWKLTVSKQHEQMQLVSWQKNLCKTKGTPVLFKWLLKYTDTSKKLGYVSLFTGIFCLSAVLLFHDYIQTSPNLFNGTVFMSGFFSFGGIVYTFQSLVVTDLLECLDIDKLKRKINPEQHDGF